MREKGKVYDDYGIAITIHINWTETEQNFLLFLNLKLTKMKPILAPILIFFGINSAIAQCDPSAIHSNESTNAVCNEIIDISDLPSANYFLNLI